MVSVLIPAAGRPEYLAQAVNSAKAQHGAVEVVVQHDHGGRGLSWTLNKAADRATGAYLTVLPDDDFYVRRDALALLQAALETEPDAAAAYSLPEYVDADGHPIHTPARLREWMTAHPRVRFSALRHGLWMHGVGVLYRRAAWQDWDEALPCCEEYEFHLRLLHGGALFVAVPVVTVAYRRHAGQKSRRGGPIGRRSAKRLDVRRMIRARYAGQEAA